jgi:hypothetical protein
MRAMPQDDLATVARLYERLTEALQRTRRDPFNVPVTVAEIYRELVPYRLVRTEIGFDMNADYEHALLRLLAGEGEWVRLEPTQAAEEIRRELHGTNPNLGLYRNYAGCDVWVRKPSSTDPRRAEPPATSPAAVRATLRPAAPSNPPAPQAATTAEQKRAFRLPFPSPPAPAPSIPEPAPAPRVPAPPAPTTAPAVRAPVEPLPVAARPKAARADEAPSPPRPQPAGEDAVEQAGERQALPEWEDAVLAGEAPGGMAFETSTLAGDDRPADREGQEDGGGVAVTRMKDTPKREAASAGEAGSAQSQAKGARPAGPQRPPAAPAGSPGRGTPPAASKVAAPAAVAPSAPKVAAARCAFCDSALPQQRQARFCPYCGADQTTRPCPSCGEPLEPGWAFCITCGATAQ